MQCPHCGGGLSLVATDYQQAHTVIRGELDLLHWRTVYVTEKASTGAWSPSWAKTSESQLNRFLDSGNELDRKGVAAFREELVGEGLKVKTINDYLVTLGSFAKYLVNRGELEANPVTGQTLKTSRDPQAERLAFQPDEVAALLAYVDSHAPKEGYKLFLRTMAYTGARNEEVAQLRPRDVYVEGEVRVFDMATLDESQKRKTAASRRLIPVHSSLEGLFETVPNPFDNLFSFVPSGGTTNPRYCAAASKWINRHAIKPLKKAGKIRDDPRLVLYSLRHSVTTQLKHKGVAESLIAELVGHTNSSMTTGRYGKRYPVEQLKGVVEKISW